ncbi:MAG: alanine/glycine:cation symporter family protein [Chitinophagaceae bacterium]
MFKKVAALFFLLLVKIQPLFAQKIDEKIDQVFAKNTKGFVEFVFYEIPFSDTVSIPWVLIVLVLSALFFTIYFKFINILGFRTAVQIVQGKHDNLEKGHQVKSSDSVFLVDGDNPDTIRVEGHTGEVSHFQALTAALSATVGLGNIAGVAVAISIGGPGATFWMIIAGLIGMSSKFVECTLGVKYREIGDDGTVYGGPMYYLSKGLKELKAGTIGKFLAIVFAVMCVGGSFGGGNMFQANQAYKMFENQMAVLDINVSGYAWVFGLVMSILVGIVIIGGIKSIARVTDKIVPFMVGIYVLAAVVILFIHAKHIPWAFGEIMSGAFTPTGITGGLIGVLIQGFRRAAFSNEAGIGSASIAHSAVITKYPASEGLVALLEPFIDTVIVCTMTALVLIISSANPNDFTMVYGQKIPDGVVATSQAFASNISWFPWILAIAVILFAFSTMISWSYYGFQAWTYLFGRSKWKEYTYKILFCLFVIVGSAASLGAVIDFSDAMIFAMMIPNMVGLIALAPKVKEELHKYKKLIHKK